MTPDPRLHPPPETGVHSWLYGRAVYMRREGFDEVAALAELFACVAGSAFRPGRTVSPREIADAVAAAYRGASPPPSGHHTATAATPQVEQFDPINGWPAEMRTPTIPINREKLSRVLSAAGNFELADLWECSPVRPPDYAAPRWALDQLFGADDLLCVGNSMSDFDAKPLRDWTDAELVSKQLIVPSPLRKPLGLTKDGTPSAHCRDTTGPRRYIVCESDAGLTTDEQARILEHLRTKCNGRLAAGVLSGGKSLHGWFRCGDVTAATLHRWFCYAVSLGADPRLWLPEQFVRLPDGTRENGRRQSLIYLDPQA